MHVLLSVWPWPVSITTSIHIPFKMRFLTHIFFDRPKCNIDLFPCRSFKEYLKRYYTRREMWALPFRDNLPIRNNHTNNFCEAGMRVLKDKILERTKAYNIPQLVDFVSNRLEDYYQRRVLDVANGRLGNVVSSRFMADSSKIMKDDIKPVRHE